MGQYRRSLILMTNTKKYYAECTTDLVEIIDRKNDSCFVEHLLIGNFGSLKKLLQVTCYVLCFVKN